MKKFINSPTAILLPIILLVSQSVFAAYDTGDTNRPFDFFTDTNNGWNLFKNDDGIRSGRGGQAFDTEYLFYKYNEGAGSLSIGLQTGFDVRDGRYGNYYGGDLALSFDGAVDKYRGTGYEYAIDFGLVSKTYDLDPINSGTGNSGVDTAGLYRVDVWNNEILHDSASPFAMDDGVLLQALGDTNNYSGFGFTDGNNNKYITDGSYYRIVTFDLSNIENLSETFTVDAHWTMSCGNDEINGSFTVAHNYNTDIPEPSALALMGIGSISLIVSGLRRRKHII